MTLEEAIKHAEEVAATSGDGCKEEYEQLATWLKELKRIKEYSIVIPNNSTEWEVARTLIDAKGMFKTWGGNYKMMKVFNIWEIARIGNHLMNYASVEETDE